MKKLTILLVILAFFCMTNIAGAAPAYGNLGPTSEIGFDIYMQDELVFEGSAADEHETTLTVTNPTADRTITVPDSDQTIGTATTITDGLILEADLNADEEPADNDILTFDTTGSNFSWQTPAELDLVATVGTPSDSQVGVWTGDGTLEGAASFTYDGSNLQFTGDLGSTGTKITKGWFTDLEVANDIAGSITGNAETVTLTDNEETAEENEILFAADAAGSGDIGVEGDGDLTYNPSTGTLTATAFAGNVTGDLTGNADTFTVTDNENEALACPIVFVDGATGDQGAESDDTDFTYNPSTGTVTGTIFSAGSYFTGEVRLVTSDADPDTTGEIKHDSSATGFTGGVLRWYDNDSSRMIVDLETDASDDDYVVAYDADADGFYMKADATAAGNFFLHLMDVDAADTDYVHAAITGTGGSNDVSTAITNPDYGRNITVTCTNNNSPSGNVTITGTTADGTTSATDAITISAGGTASGVKAFVYVSNINVPGTVPAEDSVTIGIGDVIGLQNAISAESDIYMKTVDGVEEYGEISGNGNTTYNTLDCATIVQNEDITIYYHE